MDEHRIRQASLDYETTIAAYELLAQRVYDYARERSVELFGGGAWGWATAFRNSSPTDFVRMEVTPQGIKTASSIWTSTTGGSYECVEWTVPFEALEGT